MRQKAELIDEWTFRIMFKKTTSHLKTKNIEGTCAKPVILTFVGNYLPGYKNGGVLRSVVNTVDHLCDEFEFWIVTRDRDVGDDKFYPDIEYQKWHKVGNAMVYYLSPMEISVKNILKLIIDTPHQILYLNSFFDPLTVIVLWIRKMGWAKFSHTVIAPRGEFARGSLRLKYLKKFIYTQISKLFGFYKKVVWQAASEFEAGDITKIMKINPEFIHIARDLPVKIASDKCCDAVSQPVFDNKSFKIIFLSRISREKNLDYAIKVLSRVRLKAIFDIYGPIKDGSYWKECQELISRLPDNVKVNYLGCVNPDAVVDFFSHYDLFLFPTAGESYGHVIAESLTAGTPVLISDKTIWRDLQDDGLGWDIDLTQMNSFVETIEKFASLNENERLQKRNIIKSKIMERLLDLSVLEANRQLFRL